MRFLIAAALALPYAVPALAQTADGCEQFAWPVAQEQKLFQQKDIAHAASGGTLRAGATAAAVTLDLKGMGEVQWRRPPERLPKNAASFGGVLEIAGVEAGLYQITLSDDAWIDVIQNDGFVKSAAHSGRRDCPGLHKSVRFQLGDGPVTVQLSGVPKNSIDLAIAKVSQTQK